MRRMFSLGVCGVAALAAAGCFGFEHKSTVTDPSGVGALLGTWTSSNIIPTATSCSDFRWNVTEQSANTARGTFSATCGNNLQLSGTAQGTLNGSTVNWRAQGTATAAGLLSCDFSLAGTAELAGDSIRVPYDGDTCVGHVNGVQTLRRSS